MSDNPLPGILCIGGHFDGDRWTGPPEATIYRQWVEQTQVVGTYDPNRPPEMCASQSGTDAYVMTALGIPAVRGIPAHGGVVMRTIYRVHTLTFLQAFEALVAGYGRLVPTRRVGEGEHAIRDQIGMIGEKYRRAMMAEVEAPGRELTAIMAAKPAIFSRDELVARGIIPADALNGLTVSESDLRAVEKFVDKFAPKEAPMPTEDPNRGTDRTTKQMREAPQGAIFVWCTNVTAYPRALAAQLGRRDLDIAPLDWLDGHRHRGRPPGSVVVDHAAPLTDAQRRELASLTVDNDRAD